jgi:parallel beta-helix repeat protein
MTLARDPNIADDSFKTWKWFGYENVTAVDTGASSMTFADTTAAIRWQAALGKGADMWLHGYFKFDWRDTFVRVSDITPSKTKAEAFTLHVDPTTPPAYNLTKGCRFYALNALEFLDSPGEYFINHTSGEMFFWPPNTGQTETYDGGNAGPKLSADVLVSVLPNVITSTGADHNRFEDLIISVSRGTVVDLHGDGAVLRNNTISNGGGSCAVVDGNEGLVQGCTVFGCGGSGIHLTAGDIHTLEHGNTSAVLNDVSGYSRICRTYQPAIEFQGVGMYVANNTLTDGPHCAISGGGNDNLFEFNRISHMSYECTDTGAFYVGRSWAQRGNVARYNHFDTIRPTERLAQKSCSQNAFYLDDQMSGWEFYGNTIVNSSTGVLLGGGRDNKIYDNYFLNNDIDIAFDDRGLTWQAKSCKKDCDPKLGTSCFAAVLESLNYTQPPYSAHYLGADLAHIFDADQHPCTPVRNIIKGNRWCHTSSAGGGKFVTQTDSAIQKWFSTISNNSEAC